MLSASDLARVSIGTRIRQRKYRKYLQHKKYDTILECGCGAGSYSSFLIHHTHRFIGFDLNQALVALAQKKVPEGSFFQASILSLPAKNTCSSLLIAADVIEHTDNAQKALDELARITKEDGSIIISVPAYRWEFLCRLFGQTRHDFGHTYLFKKKELFNMADQSGLTVTLHETYQGPFSAALESLIVKINTLIYGKDIVLKSGMAETAAKNSLFSYLYYWFSIIAYPLFLCGDFLFLGRVCFEHFLVLEKRKIT